MYVRRLGASSSRSSRVWLYSNSNATMTSPTPPLNPVASRFDGVGVVPRKAVTSAEADAGMRMSPSASTHEVNLDMGQDNARVKAQDAGRRTRDAARTLIHSSDGLPP